MLIYAQVVKTELESANDRRPKFEDDWDCQAAFVDCGSSSTTPIATSPTCSIGTSMPTLTSQYDELTFRPFGEDMLSSTNAWPSASHYSSGTNSYASSSSSSQGYYSRPATTTGRSQQNLPSLTEINLGQSAQAYIPRSAHLTRQSGTAPYYCPSSTDPLEISYAKASSNGYGPSIYNQAHRAPYPMSANDYTTSMYDPYCYPNGTSWPPTLQCGTNLMSSDTSSVHSVRRRRGNLPKQVTEILRGWFQDHLDHPYPTDEDKQNLMAKTQLNMSQVTIQIPSNSCLC